MQLYLITLSSNHKNTKYLAINNDRFSKNITQITKSIFNFIIKIKYHNLNLLYIRLIYYLQLFL